MANLTLIRHGQSTYNLANLFTGQLDAPLTAAGEDEARQAAIKIKDIVYNIAYTSMLIRAQETLRLILEVIHQTQIPVIKSAELNERMYGKLQGHNKAETAEKYGAAQVESWRRSYDVRPPGGESLQDTFNRAVPFFKSGIEPFLQQGSNVLVVAHGNSLRALMMYIEHQSPEEIAHLDIQTCMPKLYNFDADLKLLEARYL